MVEFLKDAPTCLCDKQSDCYGAYRHEVMVAIVPRIKYENGGFPGSYEDQKIAAKEFSEHLRSGAWQTQGKECRMRAFIVHDVHTGLVSEQC